MSALLLDTDGRSSGGLSRGSGVTKAKQGEPTLAFQREPIHALSPPNASVGLNDSDVAGEAPSDKADASAALAAHSSKQFASNRYGHR